MQEKHNSHPDSRWKPKFTLLFPNGLLGKLRLQIPTKPHQFETQETRLKKTVSIHLLFIFQCFLKK